MRAVRFASQSPVTSTLWRLFVPLCLGAAALAGGCGSERPDNMAGNVGPSAPIVAPSGSCKDGETRQCGITLGEHNGVMTCFHGVQTCEGAAWGECTDGVIEEMAAPGLRTLAISDAEECTDNPCDPYCQTYSEDPDDPIEPELSDEPPYEWETGSLADFPGGLVNKGLNEPCETGADCQFNMRCESPDQGNCGHSVCETGDALDSECNSCAELVCAADSSCCDALPTDVASCDHDPCALGEGLDDECNNCVADICSTPGLEDCCDTQGSNDNWTQDCVDAVASVCGNSCGCGTGEVEDNGSCYYYETTNMDWKDARDACEDRGEGWALVTINDDDENSFVAELDFEKEKFIGFEDKNTEWTWVGDPDLGVYDDSPESHSPAGFYENFASGQPSTSDKSECAYINNDTYTWRAEGDCDSNDWNDKRDSVCEGPVAVMQDLGGGSISEWTTDCTALAETVCDLKCNDDDPSESTGSCVPWYPGETDPNCSGVDLAVGVPCDGIIPVCNHGNSTATGPITVVHWPANSQQYPTCAPDMTHPNTVTCTITEDIPPGECVNVDGDSCLDLDGDPEPLDNGNREIMVNPEGDVTECSCLDNWSLYAGGTECSPPSCGGGNTAAVSRPIDIIVIVDNSPSMAEEIQEVQDRIHSDLAQILENSGIDYRVILISRFGDLSVPEGPSTVPICIGAPLGANACTDASNETLVNNGPIFYHHSTDIESWDSWCQLLDGFDSPDEVGITDAMWNGVPGTGRTWTALNPDGWQSRLRDDSFKHFILITDDDIECSDGGYDFDDTPSCDGFPHDCHDVTNQTASAEQMTQGPIEAAKFDAALRALSPEQFGTASERNYMWHSIVNIARHPDGDQVPWQADDPLEDGMCTPSGTTLVGAGIAYQALSILTGGLRYPFCENTSFDAIFNAVADEVIETSAATCDFSVSNDGTYDPADATVSWTDGDDVNTALAQVDSATDCGDSETSWYYDDPDDPSVLTLCPSTCDAVQADTSAQVWVEFGCPRELVETTYTETYYASCDTGQKPQWMFMYYDTTIEADTDAQVSFRVRTAQSEAGLSSATWQDAATATADSPDCAKGSPVAGACPVDMYSLLGAVEAKRDYLELEVTLTPDGEVAPTLEDWELTYSCPPDE